MKSTRPAEAVHWRSFWLGVFTVVALTIGAVGCSLAIQVVLAIFAMAKYG